MSNPNKRKGSQWEVDLLAQLRGVFPDVERAPRWGPVDKGDFVGTGSFVFEAKNQKQIDLADFIDQAVTQAANKADEGRLPYGVCLIKRRRKSPAEGYAVMRIGDFMELLDCHLNGEDRGQ